MAGSEHSGQDIEAGRTNFADDKTIIWAQQRAGEAFGGDVIFIVEAARDIDNDDDFNKPSDKLHGIKGSGVSTGAGVIGLDSSVGDSDISQLKDVGVFGKGETGIRGEGTQGPGVEGIGSGLFFPLHSPGVVGRGGRFPDEDNAHRELHGPGVIGLGGGRSRSLPADDLVGSVGVFGQGAEAEARTVGGTVHGPRSPGAGVVGRGGVSIPPGGAVAPGVVGLAGGGPILPLNIPENLNTGVFGRGATGVVGSGTAGPGVHGSGSDGEGQSGAGGSEVVSAGVVGEGGRGRDPTNAERFVHGAGVIGLASDAPFPSFAETGETGVYGKGKDGIKGVGFEGRGGVFVSEHSAQVQLVPAKGRLVPAKGLPAVEQASFTPTRVTNPLPTLPRKGQGGDLMTVIDNLLQCTLWLCVQGVTDNSPAVWTQVLLGPTFVGAADG